MEGSDQCMVNNETARSHSTNTIQSLDKSLDVLCSFTLSEPEFGISELANKLGMYKSMVFRILKTLEERGFVIQNLQNQKYRLGFKLFDLGNVVVSRLEVREVALPFMQALSSKMRETVTLNVADNDERVCIEKVESTETLRDFVQIGLRVPIHVAAPGKLMLAYLPLQEQERILSKLTQNAMGKMGKPIDVAALRQELIQIAERGYSFSNSERAIGTAAFATPIWNHEGKVIAALSISGPEARFNDERKPTLLSETLVVTAEISKRLGWKDRVFRPE